MADSSYQSSSFLAVDNYYERSAPELLRSKNPEVEDSLTISIDSMHKGILSH